VKKLIVFLAICVAAYYVVTNYFGKVGPKVTGNAKEAEQVLQQP